jgi:hypothetical protein
MIRFDGEFMVADPSWGDRASHIKAIKGLRSSEFDLPHSIDDKKYTGAK